MKYVVSYRDGEISAEVEAVTGEEACDKFLAGDVIEARVLYSFLHPDMVEAELVDDTV